MSQWEPACFDDCCLLVFMARLIYCCTAGYHILQFWPFDIQIKIPFYVSVFVLPEGSHN